ncbi:MAG: HD domain-containing protein [Calditrichaeota bacterium]|nr:MAG: HD domain-containing protein [Calditrichota bacterium]
MDSKPIADFHMGDEVTGFYVLRRADLKSRRDNQGHYLAIDLSDATGHISANVWENADKLAQELTLGEVVKIQGVVQSYQGQKRVSIKKIRKARPDDSIDMSLLVPAVEGEVSKLWREYTELASSLVNPFLKSLLRKFTEDEAFRTSFCEAPGGKMWHHGYLGGLLEHTIGVTKICEKLSSLYPEIDKDLLIAAALLHDIGKIKSYQHGPTFEYTDEGRLLGHIVIGNQMVVDKIREIPAFPAELSKRLQHLILSHQGKLEQASPVVPMTAEAFLLYYADEIDSKLNAFYRIKKREHKEETRWSSFIRLLGQFFYFGDKPQTRQVE